MIFYLKEKNKKIIELDVDLTLEYFKITDYKILSNNLPNIFENLNENDKPFGLFILNNFVKNRIYLPERIITDYIHKKDVVMLNKKVYKYDYETSPHFVNILNKFTSFTDNFSISPCPQYSDRIYNIHNVYNLKTKLITVERYDIIYQEIVDEEKNKNRLIDFIKAFYNDDYYKDFFNIKDDAVRRIGFKFKKDVKFISLSDLAIDYVPVSLSEKLDNINKYFHIAEKILNFYGKESQNEFLNSPFFDNFDLVFLLKKGDKFKIFSFF